MKSKIRLRWPVMRLVSSGQAVFILLVAVSVSFWLGMNSHWLPFVGGSGTSDVPDSQDRIRLLEKLNGELKSEAASARRSAELHSIAVDKMQASLREKEAAVQGLARELHFYRTLYTPDDRRLVRVRTFNLQKGGAADEFAYILVLTGMPKKQQKTSGMVSMAVGGTRHGVETRLDFGQISAPGSPGPLKFSLKYFQEISGNIALPEGFEPDSVHITLTLDDSSENPVSVRYDWNEVYRES